MFVLCCGDIPFTMFGLFAEGKLALATKPFIKKRVEHQYLIQNNARKAVIDTTE